MKALQKILNDTAKSVAGTHVVDVCTGEKTVEIFDLDLWTTACYLSGEDADSFIAAANVFFLAADVTWTVACQAQARICIDNL